MNPFVKSAMQLCLVFGILIGSISQSRAQQCSTTTQCGQKCCQSTESCYLGKCIPLGKSCIRDAQCKSTEFCETKLKRCFTKQGADLRCIYKPKDPKGQYSTALMWKFGTNAAYQQSMVTPVVMAMQDSNLDGKIDDKDIPSVIYTGMFRYFGGGIGRGAVHVLRGTDGKLLFTVGRGQIHGWSSIAVGDIDNDGKPEIVVWRYNSSTGFCAGVNAYSNTGKLKWTSKNAKNQISPVTNGLCYYQAPVITDMDGDGKVEVVVGSTIIDGKTGKIQCTGHTYSYTTFTADINGDGKLEIITGTGAYTKSCKNLWKSGSGPGGTHSAIADFNKDGQPEIVVASGNLVRVADGKTGKLLANLDFSKLSLRDKGGKGPALGDVNGDGIPEIGVGARDYFHMFKFDYKTKKITRLWAMKTHDYSSNGVSSTMFDFNFNGRVADVYNDEFS